MIVVSQTNRSTISFVRSTMDIDECLC